MGITNIEVPANSSNTFSTANTDGSGSVGRTDYSNANMWNEVSGPVAICNVANNTARINDAARANVASRAAVRDANANTDDSAGRGNNNIDTVAAAVSAAMSASQASCCQFCRSCC
jgi:type IV secretory pathway TrbL component